MIASAFRPCSKITCSHQNEFVLIPSAAVIAIYAYTRELLTNRRVSDESYQRAMTHFGERGVVELTSLIGYYSMIAMTLNEHRVPMPGGAAPKIPDVPV